MTDSPAWLRDIPSHWLLKPLGFAVSVVGGATPSKEKAEFWDGSVPWVSPKDMKSFDLDDSEDHVTDMALGETSLAVVKPPAVLMVIRGMILIHTVPVAVNRVPVTLNQDMKALVPGPDYSARFLAYMLRAANPALLALVEEAGHGTRCLRTEVWTKLKLPVPPRSEQDKIVAVLDRRCADLDEIITSKNRMLDLLKEKRQALVTRLVTRGLNVTGRLKDSRIPGLGLVPEHWLIERLKFSLKCLEQGWSPQCDTRPADDNEWGVLKAGCVNHGSFDESENKALPETEDPLAELEIKPGDVLVSRASGSPELVGSAAQVKTCRPRLLLCDKLFRLHCRLDKLLPAFAAATLNSAASRAQIEQAINGAEGLANNITQSTLRNLVFTLPPVDEQAKIIEALDACEQHFSDAVERLNEQLFKLREYRQALITAAVTGKLDVRRKTAV